MHPLPRPLRLSALLVAAGCLTGPAPAALATVGDSLEARVIVRFKADAPVVKARAMRANAAEHEALDIAQRRADTLGQRAAWALQGGRSLDGRTHVITARGIDSATLRQRLAMDPQVELVAVDRIRRISRVPNDPIYGNGSGVGPAVGQWYLKPPGNGVVSSINAEQAWDLTTGSASVAVAVIDTGVRLDHPDLAGNLLPGYDMIGAGGGGAVRLAVANDGNLADADPSDPGDWVNQADIDGGSLGTGCTRDDISNSSWHGTRVAGLISAVSDNGLGMAGVSWASKIVPIRALGKCGGYDSDILAGVRWAVGASVPGLPTNANPVKVVNMSLGSTGACTGSSGQLYIDAFAEANARGAVVVVAAGNSAGKPVDSPANCAGAIAVTGLRHIGSKVGFSSMGPEVALGAPGGNCVNLSGACLYPMVTTTNSGTQGPLADTYTFNGASVGTSFATPLVAGVAALLYARNPNLTPAQVRAALVGSTRPFPTTGAEAGVAACTAPSSATEQLECYCTTSTCGTGMLDARAALLSVTAPPAPAPSPAPVPPPAPSPSPSPAPAPSTGGGGGGASQPLWLLGLALVGWCLPGRRRAALSGSRVQTLRSPPPPPAAG
jgi:serine protease